MITPRFELSQTENTLTIIIRAPYCSLKELDVQVDEETFLFYCKPYYLRLNLPGKLDDENNAHSAFDSEKGEFTFTYDKRNRGEIFENLEFITKFLCPKVDVVEEGRKIEVLTSTPVNEDDIVDADHQYGFAQRGGYQFNFINSEFSEIFELNPFEIPLDERTSIRKSTEKTAFSFDHYFADYIDCEEIDSIIAQKAQWKADKFTSEELDYLKDLPNIQYELSSKQKMYVFTSLLDILYAYCYDRRTTWYEGTCESGWTILKLSSSLCYFDAFSTPRDAILSTCRRSLIYPLYRNFNLSIKVLEDLKEVIKLGEIQLIKILIEMHHIFLKGDSARYILNHLFIKDYITYIQKWDKTQWNSIVEEVQKLEIEKKDVELNLDEIEAMTRDTSESESEAETTSSSSEEDEDVLNKKLEKLSLQKAKSNQLDSDDDSSNTESESETAATVSSK